MNPRKLDDAFRVFLTDSGVNPSTSPTADGVRSMIRFYAGQRADGCDPESEEDTLLFQWGVYDWGHGEKFEIDITRQVMMPGGVDDDAIWQLHLTYHWPPSAEFKSLGSDDRWCRSLSKVSEFERYVAEARPLAAVANRSDGEHEILFERAG